MSSYDPLLEGKTLVFSDLNKVSHIPTREIVRRISSNKRLHDVLVDQELTIPKKRSIYEAIYGQKHIETVQFLRGVDPVAVGLHLRRMNNIKNVGFRRTSLSVFPDPFTPAHFLMPNRNLQELFLVRGNMGDVAAQAVLQSVRLRCCLRRIDFRKTGLTNHGVISLGQTLQHHSMLTGVFLADDLVVEEEAGAVLARGIEMNTSIKRLTLVVKQMAAAGCELVFRGLTANATLNEVTITLWRNNREVSVGAVHLLSWNNTLAKLCLTSKNPNVTQITDALATNESLETFGIGKLDASGIECVCNAFERNTFVNNLAFKHSRITVEGTSPICRILSKDPTLKSLDLLSCQLDDESVVALCESAAHSQSLDSLEINLVSNDGNRGNSALADFVSSSQLIKRLCVSFNNGDDGFAALGTALEHNVSLEELKVRKVRNVTHRGTRALLDGVKVHPMLTKVKIASLTKHVAQGRA